MPFESASEPFVDAIEAAAATQSKHGAVLKPFNGPMRRFIVGYVVLDTDAADLPISMEELKAKGFIA